MIYRVDRHVLNSANFYEQNLQQQGSHTSLRIGKVPEFYFTKSMWSSLAVLSMDLDLNEYSNDKMNEKTFYLRNFSEYVSPLSRLPESRRLSNVPGPRSDKIFVGTASEEGAGV